VACTKHIMIISDGRKWRYSYKYDAARVMLQIMVSLCHLLTSFMIIFYYRDMLRVQAIGHFKSKINSDFLKGLSVLRIKMVEANISKSF
jgi:hypothetical protein